MKYILGTMSFTLQNKSSNLKNDDIQNIVSYYKVSVKQQVIIKMKIY